MSFSEVDYVTLVNWTTRDRRDVILVFFMHVYVHGHNVVEYCIDGRFGGELNVAVWPFMTKPASINLPIFFSSR